VFVPGNLAPYFDKGFVITRELETAGPDVTNVTLWGINGTRFVEARIWFDGAVRVWISHAALTRNGQILASGGAVTSSGQRARFIAKTDLRGNVTDTIRTDDFVPVMICSAPDGTVWSFGRELVDGRERPTTHMLRQYSFQKGLVASYLPRSSFDTKVSPVVHRGAQGSYLDCSANKVVVYVARTNEYIELNYSDHMIRRWTVDAAHFRGFWMQGLAVTDSGAVYASAMQDGNWAGLYELILDGPETGRWELVPGTFQFDEGEGRMRSSYGMLHGTHGDSLVLGSTPQGLAWVRPVMSGRHSQ